MTQLDLIEPTGSELARLASFHASDAAKQLAAAELWELRGVHSLVAESERAARRSLEYSCHCLSAFEFEQLGGFH